MRAQLHQPFGGQGLQGLADRDPADLEALRDLILAELLPEAQRAEQNLPAQCLMDDLGPCLVPVQREPPLIYWLDPAYILDPISRSREEPSNVANQAAR
jgi:hypothetical protein